MAQLQVSADKHYFTDGGVPKLLIGTAPWDFNNATYTQWKRFIDTCVVYHLNWMEMRLMSNTAFCGPANVYGVNPWSGTQTFASSTTEAFWLHVDSCIGYAKSKGIYCNLYPDYLGGDGSSQGFAVETGNSSTAQMKSWGQFVGGRYKDSTNIVWSVSGDLDPRTYQTKLDSMVAGIKAAGDTHLLSTRDQQGTTTDTYWGGRTWLDFGGTYPYWNTYSPQLIYQWGYNEYNRTPTRPSRGQEFWYAHEHTPTTSHQLILQTWYAYLSGTFASVTYGDCPLWNFDCSTFGQAACAGISWTAELGDSAMQFMGNVYHVLNGRNWWKMIPDSANAVADSGFGTNGNDTYCTTVKTLDSSFVMTYMPTAHNIRVKLGFVRGDSAHCYWYSIRDGATTDLGNKALATTTFTAPKPDVLFIADSYTNPGATFVNRILAR